MRLTAAPLSHDGQSKNIAADVAPEILRHDPGLAQLCQVARDMFDLPFAGISLCLSEGTVFVAGNVPEDLHFNWMNLPCGQSACSQPVLSIRDLASDTRVTRIPKTASGTPLRAYAGARLDVARGGCLGTLCIIDTSPRDFTDADTARLENLAELATSLLEKLLLQKRSPSSLERQLTETTNRVHQLSAMVDRASIEIYAVNADTLKFVYVNETARSRLGYSMEELAEMTPANINPEVPLDNFSALALRVRENPRETIRIRTRHLPKTGAPYRVEVSLSEGNFQGHRVIFGHVIETTGLDKLKEQADRAEDLAKSVLHASQNGFLALSAVRNDANEVTDFAIMVATDTEPRVVETPAADLIGRRISELYPDRTGKAFQETLAFVLASGQPQSYEHVTEKPNQTDWFQVFLNRIDDNRVAATFTPITDLKRAEEDLLAKADEMEQILALNNSILESNQSSIMSLKAVRNIAGDIIDMDVLLVNAAIYRSTGRRSDDVINRRLLSVFPGLKPTGIFDRYVNVIESGIPLTFDTQYQQDGLNEWFHVSAVPSGPDTMTLTFTPITDQKLAEEQIARSHDELRLVLDNMPVRVFFKDDQNRILNLNREAAQTMGYESVDPLIGADTYELFPDMAAKYHEDDLKVIESGEPLRGIIEVYAPKDAPHRWITTDKVPLTLADGSRRLLAVATDITERIEREKDLERLNQSLKDFAYVAAHDLQAPLRQAALFAEIVREEIDEDGIVLNEEARESFDMMTGSINNMRAIVRSLYELASLEARTLDLTPAPLGDIVDTARRALQLEAEERNASFHIQDDLPNVLANAELLARVFQNLFSNALKYVPDAPTITVDHRWSPATIQHIVTVTDNGPGIPSDVQEQVFEPFKRLQNQTDASGAGIGLSLCRKILAAHGGTIRIDPDHKGGTRFIIALRAENAV